MNHRFTACSTTRVYRVGELGSCLRIHTETGSDTEVVCSKNQVHSFVLNVFKHVLKVNFTIADFNEVQFSLLTGNYDNIK